MYFLFSRYSLLTASLCTLMISLPVISNATAIQKQGTDNMVPTGKGWGIIGSYPQEKMSDKIISQNGIFYHGGPVMGTTTSTIPNAYFIWYGNWTGNSAINILTNLIKNIGQTPYYRINTTYQDGSRQPVLPVVNFPLPGIFDNYSHGSALSDKAIFDIVSNAINKGSLPLDKNGIYFVLTSADVNETSGFCSQYCGWHTFGRIRNNDIKYSFIGNPDRCPDACAAQRNSPNRNAGADGMASVIAHELEETVTDPNLNAWYDDNGEENADKCAWHFGPTKTTDSGAQYNVTINGLKYLIQQNWVNTRGGFCAMSF